MLPASRGLDAAGRRGRQPGVQAAGPAWRRPLSSARRLAAK